MGVAEDAKYADLREARRPMLYVPFTQVGQNLGEIQVRTAGDPSAAAATIYRELAAVDHRLAIVGVVQARGPGAGATTQLTCVGKSRQAPADSCPDQYVV